MRRFAVVRYNWRDESKVPVHELLGSYHGESIDEMHMLLLGHVHLSNFMTLDNHPAVWLLPSVHSARRLKDHAHQRGKHGHFLTLSRLGITDRHCAMDLAEIAYEKFGHKFALDD